MQNKLPGILFVDDEQNILQGLKRNLRVKNKEWDICFASNGLEALDKLAAKPIKVMVTDMRMPKMNGSELLLKVKQQYPNVHTIILSGYESSNLIMRSLMISHQYLSKPCNISNLIYSIDKLLELDNLTDHMSDKVRDIFSGDKKLPILPEVYNEIIKHIDSKNCTAKSLGEIIETDIAMTSKILQIFNSAYYNLPRDVTSISGIVNYVGIHTIIQLIQFVSVHDIVPENISDKFNLRELWDKSKSMSNFAEKLLKIRECDPITIYWCKTASLLYGVGIVMLCVNFPDEYAKVLKLLDCNLEMTLQEAEQKIFATNHCEIGYNLMNCWGLPLPVLESIKYYANPAVSNDCIDRNNLCLASVYVANVHTSNALGDKNFFNRNNQIDENYLQNFSHNSGQDLLKRYDDLRSRT